MTPEKRTKPSRSMCLLYSGSSKKRRPCFMSYTGQTAEDTKINELKQHLQAHSRSCLPLSDASQHLITFWPTSGGSDPFRQEPIQTVVLYNGQRKAPSVNPFMGEDLKMQLED